jgi:hypothetical protein
MKLSIALIILVAGVYLYMGSVESKPSICSYKKNPMGSILYENVKKNSMGVITYID